MSEFTKRRDLLEPAKRYQIYKSVYEESGRVTVKNKLFKMNAYEIALDNALHTKYPEYCRELAIEEFKSKVGRNSVDTAVLRGICNNLGLELFSFLNVNSKRLTQDQEIEVVRVIENILKSSPEICTTLVTVLGLLHVDSAHTLLPKDTNGMVCTPSEMTRSIQGSAEQDGRNIVFPYPFGIEAHFPVIFCHSVFSDFIDIVFEKDPENPVIAEYKSFMNNNDIASRMDNCLASLIMAILDGLKTRNEGEFVSDAIDAFEILFQRGSFGSSEILVCGIERIPLLVIEAKHNCFSVDAVLQGAQYYGILKMDYIDNDPCFLMIIDKGILFIYGMAKVNRRVVCSFLLSLEFTSHHFDINDFSSTLYRCINALYFLHRKIESRLAGKADDQTHQKYHQLKMAASSGDRPCPGIFSVGGVNISYEKYMAGNFRRNEDLLAHFKPCIYLVKTADGRDAILKLACNYDIQIHEKLQKARPSLAPRIIAKELRNSKYQIILMEYLGEQYSTLFKYLSRKDDEDNKIDCVKLKHSLEAILRKLKSLGIVHGDFRSGNILAKRSRKDPSVLEDFKLIDFEFSGKVGTPYPFLAMRNDAITWPADFNSYMPRKHEHDEFMLKQMIREEF